MTIVTHGDEATLEQIVKQLNKLPNVIKVQDFHEGEFVDRELVLVKVAVDSKSRAEVMQITDIFRAKIVDVQPKTLTIEITGAESKVEKFIGLMDSFGVSKSRARARSRCPESDSRSASCPSSAALRPTRLPRIEDNPRPLATRASPTVPPFAFDGPTLMFKIKNSFA